MHYSRSVLRRLEASARCSDGVEADFISVLTFFAVKLIGSLTVWRLTNLPPILQFRYICSAATWQFDDDVEGTGMGEGEGKKDVTDQIEDEEQLLGLKGDEPDKDQAEESKELGKIQQ